LENVKSDGAHTKLLTLKLGFSIISFLSGERRKPRSLMKYKSSKLAEEVGKMRE
jgi:hypothetical protein